ncbi:MAG: hypothetical protein PVG07_07005, partial [Acidobacteriota bacterium]|jgi:hypothetical protein
VVFQYNPHTLTRTVKPRASGGDAAKGEAFRLSGPPEETIKVDVEIDAADQLERGEPAAARMGIYPQLSALEMLVYPKTALVLANTALLAAGTIEVIPPPGPFTVLIWGPRRVVPVRLTDLSITEEAHDPQLNPIRAKASLGLRVLSYHDLPTDHPGHGLFLSHQVIKEVMATLASAGSLGSLATGSARVL